MGCVSVQADIAETRFLGRRQRGLLRLIRQVRISTLITLLDERTVLLYRRTDRSPVPESLMQTPGKGNVRRSAL
jgi:hypothetical protein